MLDISIIIPTYNRATLLERAIDSCLEARTDALSLEIIVVDDGSTDDSRAIVAQFGDSVQYVWQANRGLSAARNTGIKLAHGEFIGVLDADDMYEPDFMSTLVSVLRFDPILRLCTVVINLWTIGIIPCRRRKRASSPGTNFIRLWWTGIFWFQNPCW